MNYIIYILFPPSCDQFYIGHTSDLKERLFRHNNSGSKFTKKTNDWIVKYTEDYSTKAEAAARELQIKKKKSRKYIEWLICSPERFRDVLHKKFQTHDFCESQKHLFIWEKPAPVRSGQCRESFIF